MQKRYRFLFTSPGFYGHIAPSLAVAKHLVAQGHRVGFATGSASRRMIEHAGIHDFFPRDAYQTCMDKITLSKSIYDYWPNIPRIFTPAAVKTMITELLAVFESFQPDVVYIDTMDLLSVAVADRFKLPYAHGCATSNFYLEKGIPPIGTRWDINSPRINRFKALLYIGFAAPFMFWAYRNNMKVLRSIDKDWDTSGMLRGVSPYLYMLFSTDKLEYPRKVFIPEIFYVGPSLLEQNEGHLPDFPWEKLDTSKALIYVATGTIQYHTYRQLYHNIIKALVEDVFPGYIQVVMAVGKGQALEAFGALPSNFIVVPYAPQVKLLQRASVFITHGGANSVNEALFYGKPLLVIASGRDPISVAQRVAYNGAGISLKPGHATVRTIRRSIIELLNNPRYARAAEGVMASYRRCDGPRTAAGLILKLAESREPIRRRPGAPITLHHIDELPHYTDGTL